MDDEIRREIIRRHKETAHSGGAIFHKRGSSFENGSEDLMLMTYDPLDPRDLPPGVEIYRDASGYWKRMYTRDTGGLPLEMHANRYAMAGDTILTPAQLVASPLLTRNFAFAVAADGSITAADLVAAVATDQHVLYDAAIFVENVADNNDGGFARLRDGTAILADAGIQQPFRGCRNFGTNKPIEIQAPAANFVAVAANHQIVITYRTITP